MLKKSFSVLIGCLVMGVAWAQSLVVSSPNNGDYLGTSNQIKFNIPSITSQAKVVATTTKKDDPTTSFRVEGLFDPNVDNKINASLDLNFDQATPVGVYDIVVQLYVKGVLTDSHTVAGVNIDTKAPKFKNLSPAKNAFVNTFVSIRAQIEEINLDRWTVQINNKDIPNNTGNTTTINVTWDASLVEKDGSQTITISVKDLARNNASRSISVTLDRIPPSIAILSPANISYRPNGQIPVSVTVTDQASGSVTNGGVDVVIKSMTGQFIGRVARRSARSSGNSLQWTGRISATKRMPSEFKVVVTAVDRAGNAAKPQEAIVKIGG